MQILVVLIAVTTARGLPFCSFYCKALLSGFPMMWLSECDCTQTDMTYEPNDTSIFYKPANYKMAPDPSLLQTQFVIANPTIKHRHINSTVSNNYRNKSELRTITVKTNEHPTFKFDTNIPFKSIKSKTNHSNDFYMDIDFNFVDEVQKNVEHSTKHYGLLERNLTECVEMQILKFIRSCNSTDVSHNYKYKLDDYVDYTDEELKTEVENKCREIADIVENSIKQIREKWSKKNISTSQNNEIEYTSRLTIEPLTEVNQLNTEINQTYSHSNQDSHSNVPIIEERNVIYNKTIPYNINIFKLFTKTKHNAVAPKIPDIQVDPIVYRNANTVTTQRIIKPTTTVHYAATKETKSIFVTTDEFNEETCVNNETTTPLSNTKPQDILETMTTSTLEPDVASETTEIINHGDNLEDENRNEREISTSWLSTENITNRTQTKQGIHFIPVEVSTNEPRHTDIPTYTNSNTQPVTTTAKPEPESQTIDCNINNNIDTNEESTDRSSLKSFESDSVIDIANNTIAQTENTVNSNLYSETLNEIRPKIQETETPIIRIITREYPNGTVSSEINGTEILPNDDFTSESKKTSLQLRSMTIDKTASSTEKIYNFVVSRIGHNITKEHRRSDHADDITGKLYFLYKDQKMPARFVQDSDGNINIGIDTIGYCKNIDLNDSSVILKKICECIKTNQSQYGINSNP